MESRWNCYLNDKILEIDLLVYLHDRNDSSCLLKDSSLILEKTISHARNLSTGLIGSYVKRFHLDAKMNAEKEVPLIFGNKSMYKCLQPILQYRQPIRTTEYLWMSELSSLWATPGESLALFVRAPI